MENYLGDRHIKKISIALDASPFCLALANGVVSFSFFAKSAIDFICVEDENLIRLSSQPLAKPVSLFSGGFSAINKDMVDQMLRLQISAANKAMQTAIGDREIEHNLVIRRGRVRDEIMLASSDSDLLILGWSGWRAANFFGTSTIDTLLHRKKKYRCEKAIGSSVYSIMKNSKTSVLALRDSLDEINNLNIVIEDKKDASRQLSFLKKFETALFEMKNENIEDKKEKLGINVFYNKDIKTDEIKGLLSDFSLKANEIPVSIEEDFDFSKVKNDSVLLFGEKSNLSKKVFLDSTYADKIPCSILIVR